MQEQAKELLYKWIKLIEKIGCLIGLGLIYFWFAIWVIRVHGVTPKKRKKQAMGLPKGFKHSEKTKIQMSYSHRNEDIFTSKEIDRIISSPFGAFPTIHDNPKIRTRKRHYRIQLYGIHIKCRACKFNCKVLQFTGKFTCFEFRKKDA